MITRFRFIVPVVLIAITATGWSLGPKGHAKGHKGHASHARAAKHAAPHRSAPKGHMASKAVAASKAKPRATAKRGGLTPAQIAKGMAYAKAHHMTRAQAMDTLKRYKKKHHMSE